MKLKKELIKYAIWYDRAVMPEYAQTDEADLVQNVDSYLQTEGKNLVLSNIDKRVNEVLQEILDELPNYKSGMFTADMNSALIRQGKELAEFEIKQIIQSKMK